MARFKRISPWLACLAIVLNMLAMPLSRAMQTPDMGLGIVAVPWSPKPERAVRFG